MSPLEHSDMPERSEGDTPKSEDLSVEAVEPKPLEDYLGVDVSELTSAEIGHIKSQLLEKLRQGNFMEAGAFMGLRRGRSSFDDFYRSPEWVEAEKSAFEEMVRSDAPDWRNFHVAYKDHGFRYIKGEEGADLRMALGRSVFRQTQPIFITDVLIELEPEELRDPELRANAVHYMKKAIDDAFNIHLTKDVVRLMEFTDEEKVEIVNRSLSEKGSWYSIASALTNIHALRLSQYIDRDVLEEARAASLQMEIRANPERGLDLALKHGMLGHAKQFIKGMVGSDIAVFKKAVDAFKNVTGVEIVAPWSETIDQMEREFEHQKTREDYDPWRTDLEPLLATSIGSRVVDLESEKDGEYLLDYLQTYGMFNMPTIFRWHVEMKRAGSLKDLPDDVRSEIENGLVIRLEKMPNIGFVTKEIMKRRSEILTSLLEDDVPEFAVRSRVGSELLRCVIGASEFERDEKEHTPVTLLETWLATTERRPSVMELAEGYEEFEVVVPGRRAIETSDTEELERGTERILGNPDLTKALDVASEAHMAGILLDDVPKWWRTKQEQLVGMLKEKIDDLEKKLEETSNDRAKKSMAIRKKALEDKRAELAALVLGPEHEGQEAVTLLNGLSGLAEKKDPAMSLILRTLSAKDMTDRMPEGMRLTLSKAMMRAGLGWNRENVQAWDHYMRSYVAEHYLHPDPEGHLLEGPRLSESTRKKLGLVWGLGGDLEKNPIMRSEKELRDLEAGRFKDSGTVKVSVIPVRGPMRIFAGDVGNACYTSEHQNLAEGEYDKLTAFMYVTGRGTVNERIQGSVLAIEAQEDGGEGVLLVRANNPKQSFLSQVDVKTFLDGVMQGMRSLAERRKFTKVLVPYDHASASVSNREEVDEYVKTSRPNPPFVRLLSTDETNFNGYPNWNDMKDEENPEVHHPSALFYDLRAEKGA